MSLALATPETLVPYTAASAAEPEPIPELSVRPLAPLLHRVVVSRGLREWRRALVFGSATAARQKAHRVLLRQLRKRGLSTDAPLHRFVPVRLAG